MLSPEWQVPLPTACPVRGQRDESWAAHRTPLVHSRHLIDVGSSLHGLFSLGGGRGPREVFMTRTIQYGGIPPAPLQYLGCSLSPATRRSSKEGACLVFRSSRGFLPAGWVLLFSPLPCIFLEIGPPGHPAGVWEARAMPGRPHSKVLPPWLQTSACQQTLSCNLSLVPISLVTKQLESFVHHVPLHHRGQRGKDVPSAFGVKLRPCARIGAHCDGLSSSETPWTLLMELRKGSEGMAVYGVRG